MGAVLIEGPKWCGKTTTAEQQAKSVVYMDDTEEGSNWQQLAVLNPKGVLAGKTPRLIDEWQMAAWNPNLRSKTAIRTSDNRYFVDPSIATAALGLGPNDLMNDLNTFGLFFETLCVRDLRVFADALDGQVYHYRDKNGLECDTVVHLRNGSYGLVEIKLGGENLINEGVAALTELTNKIDTTKMKAPSFRMVLTAVGKFAYRRDDGIYIVPIGCLRD